MGLPVVTAASDSVARAPKDEEHRADEDQDDPDGLQDGDLGDQADDEHDDPQDDHGASFTPGAACGVSPEARFI